MVDCFAILPRRLQSICAFLAQTHRIVPILTRDRCYSVLHKPRNRWSK